MYTNLQHIMLGFLAVAMVVIAPAVQAQGNDILVVPARARIIRLGTDIHALRGPTLISYDITGDPLHPFMHVWNRSRRTWQRIDILEIQQPRNVPAQPNRVYLIGLREEIPAVISDAFSHAKEVKPLQTLSVADILTVLDQDMQFSMPEWRALAQRYDLEMTERNAEERRWGRFGPPRRYRQRDDEAVMPTDNMPDIEPVQWDKDIPAADLPSDEPIKGGLPTPKHAAEPDLPQEEQVPERDPAEQEAFLESLMEDEPQETIDPVQKPQLDQPPMKGQAVSPLSPEEDDFPIK